jgi:hypothetical protein
LIKNLIDIKLIYLIDNFFHFITAANIFFYTENLFRIFKYSYHEKELTIISRNPDTHGQDDFGVSLIKKPSTFDLITSQEDYDGEIPDDKIN